MTLLSFLLILAINDRSTTKSSSVDSKVFMDQCLGKRPGSPDADEPSKVPGANIAKLDAFPGSGVHEAELEASLRSKCGNPMFGPKGIYPPFLAAVMMGKTGKGDCRATFAQETARQHR